MKKTTQLIYELFVFYLSSSTLVMGSPHQGFAQWPELCCSADRALGGGS